MTEDSKDERRTDLWAGIWGVFDRRYQLDDAVQFLRHKLVPVGQRSSVWYYFGGVTTFFFIVQIVTGILLLMHYQPGENTSYESMKRIITQVPWGWLIRSTHCWSAHLMIVSLLIHMFSVFFTKAYRFPREFTWYGGFFLFSLTLVFGFSGYLLPWNELSYFATAVGTDSVKSVPLVGPWLLRVLRGGDEVTIGTLYRFFALHVCILPILTFGVLAIHVAQIQRQGMSEPPDAAVQRGTRRAMRFFPNFMLRDLLLWIVCLNVLAVLSVCFPYGTGIAGLEWELGAKADPLKPAYPGIKPEWYFLWIYQLLREFPAHVGGIEGPQACLFVVTIAFAAWFFIPLLDRNAAREKCSPAFTDFGCAILYSLVFLTLKAWDIGVTVPHGVDPAADPERLRAITKTTAWMTMGILLAVTVVRWVVLRSRFIQFTLLVALHIVLHALFGMGYVAAGACAVAVFAILVAHLARGVFVVCLCLSASQWLPTIGVADDQVAGGQNWPESFQRLLQATEAGKAVVDPLAAKRFADLPPGIQELFFVAVGRDMIASPHQLQILLDLNISHERLGLVLRDNCILCHTNPELQEDRMLFRARADDRAPNAHLDLRRYLSDAHFRPGLSCAGCHGGKPTDEDMSDEIYRRWPERAVREADRGWIPEFCSRCHSDPKLMRSFNPSLPIDQHIKYAESEHGIGLLQRHDNKAAQCVSCHSAHGILAASNPASTVFPRNIPDTCGACHSDANYMGGYQTRDGKPMPTNQVALYRQGMHGKALFEKDDMGVAVCNDCHGNHAAMPTGVAAMANVCRTCHLDVGGTFDNSPMASAFQGHAWPECQMCHGNHDNASLTFEELRPEPGGLCMDCHEQHGSPESMAAAAVFYTNINDLFAKRRLVTHEIADLRREIQALDLDDLNFRTQRLDDQIEQLRLLLHSFTVERFGAAITEAAATADQILASCADIRRDHKMRRYWLLLLTGIITFIGILLFLKIREIDHDYPWVDIGDRADENEDPRRGEPG